MGARERRAVLALVLYELVAGLVVGLVVGRLGALLLSRLALPSSGLYPLATVSLALFAFTAGNAAHASGFLSVYVAALVLGNATLPHRRAVIGFASRWRCWPRRACSSCSACWPRRAGCPAPWWTRW